MKHTSAIAALMIASAAYAHHSFADFDRSKTQSLTGTLRAVEWENPHSWIWVNVTGANGQVLAWGFEGSAPAEMSRNGFKKDQLQKGDQVTIKFHPLRDGRNGGSLISVVKADGTAIGG